MWESPVGLSTCSTSGRFPTGPVGLYTGSPFGSPELSLASHVMVTSTTLVVTLTRREDDRPRDPPAGRPGLPRPGRRAALPAHRRRGRRTPRDRAARRARHRRGRPADHRRPVRLPRLRHHRQRGAPPRRRATCAAPSPRASTGAGWPCSSAASATAVGFVLAEPLVGLFGAGDAVSEQATTYLRIAIWGTTPLLLMLATTGVLRGPPGHPHPAVGRRRRQRRQHRPQRHPRLRPRPRHRRLRDRLGPRPGRQRRRPRRRRRPGRPPRGRAPLPRPARHPRRRPRRHPAGDAHADAARLPARRHVRRDARRHRHRARPGHPPDRPHPVDLPRLRPRRAGHRRPGDHRPRARRR